MVQPCENRFRTYQAGFGALSTIGLPRVWKVEDPYGTLQNSTPLPRLHVSVQTRGRVFRGRDPRECRHDGIRDFTGMFLLFINSRREIRERAGGAFYHGAGVPGRFLSSQLELVARL